MSKKSKKQRNHKIGNKDIAAVAPSLTPTETKSLKTLLKKVMGGEIALFIGAGASLNSGSPSGKELVDFIKENFNDVDFEDIGYNLLDVCQEIEENGRRVALEKFVKNKFYGLKPTDAHLTLPKYPWPAIFTTNYDDLIEKAYEKYYGENERNTRICKPIIRGDTPHTYHNEDEVRLFKLMGDFKRDDPEETPVLTRTDYNNRSDSRRKMLEIFSNFVHDGAVLYVGYSFRDRIAFELIDELRTKRNGNPDRSFALVPNLDGKSKIEGFITKREITPIPLTFEEFVNELKKSHAVGIPTERKTANISLKLKNYDMKIPYREYIEFREYFKIICEEDLQKSTIEDGLTEEKRIERFLKGQSENWEAFEKGWDFKRDIYLNVKNSVEKEIDKNRPENNDAILLLGGGGLGKSIMLKRLAYDLYEAGNPVIIVNDYLSFFDYKLIDKFCQDVNSKSESNEEIHKVVIIFDNIDANIDNIKKMLVYLKNHSKPAVIVGAARPNEWEYLKHKWRFGEIIPSNNIFEIPQKMDDEKEIKRLVEHLGKILNSEELLTNLDYWVTKALTDYENDFFSIIYSLVDPAKRNLNEIIWDEYKKLPSEPAKRAYEYICLFYQYDMPLKLEMIVSPLQKIFNYSYREFLKDVYEKEAKSLIIELEKDIPGDIFGNTNLFYRAKNKIIAQNIVKKLFDSSDKEQLETMIERYSEVLSEVKALDQSEMNIVRSLLVKYLGPNGIDNEKIDMEHLVKLYDIILNKGIEDSTVLHHYGMLESDNGNFEKAKGLLNRSLISSKKYRGGSLGKETERNILNSLGVLYSKEALKNLPDSFDTALMLYDKANFYFKSSKMRDIVSPYSYHSQAFSSFKRGVYYDDIGQLEDACQYFSEALDVIEDAKESVPDYELESIVSLESKIYNDKFGDFNTAKNKLLLFIENAPDLISGYVLISRLIFEEAKKYRSNPSKYEDLLNQSLFYVEEGLNISENNQNLLKLNYYILKQVEPDNSEKIYGLLIKRYEAFNENCSELKLLFDLGVMSFEQGKYKVSNRFFNELNKISYDHPDTSGIKRVAKDSDNKDKIYKGYISDIWSKSKGQVMSEEIGYSISFNPLAQKRELHDRQDVECNVAFNYRGIFAIDLRPL